MSFVTLSRAVSVPPEFGYTAVYFVTYNQFTDIIFTTSNFSCQHKFAGFVDRLVDTWESIKILTKFISKTVIISMVWKS